jgi:hypothetical protein
VAQVEVSGLPQRPPDIRPGGVAAWFLAAVAGRYRCLPGPFGEEFTGLPPGEGGGSGGDGALAQAAGHVEVHVRLPGVLDPVLLEADLLGEGPQFVFGVGEQVTPPAAHDFGAVRLVGLEVHVIDVDGHRYPRLAVPVVDPGSAVAWGPARAAFGA